MQPFKTFKDFLDDEIKKHTNIEDKKTKKEKETTTKTYNIKSIPTLKQLQIQNKS